MDRKHETATRRLVAHVVLHQIGTQRPYFSVTGTLRELIDPFGNGVHAQWTESGGCLHDEILAQWPDLAPAVALHLADIDGVPMYAFENGYYWLAGACGGLGQTYHGRNSQPARCLQVFADLERISLETAAAVRDLVATMSANPDVGPKEARLWFAGWCDEQRMRWQAEAAAVIAQFGLTVTRER